MSDKEQEFKDKLETIHDNLKTLNKMFKNDPKDVDYAMGLALIKMWEFADDPEYKLDPTTIEVNLGEPDVITIHCSYCRMDYDKLIYMDDIYIDLSNDLVYEHTVVIPLKFGTICCVAKFYDRIPNEDKALLAEMGMVKTDTVAVVSTSYVCPQR